MFLKSTTIVASTMVALLQSTRASQQRQILLVAAIATFILWRLYASINASAKHEATISPAEVPVTAQKSATVKWSYDEFAHKLIMENTDLVYAEVGQGFSRGIGKVLTKVTKQIDGKPVIVNL